MKSLLLVILIYVANPIFSQSKQFIGTWTKENTTYQFDFDLILKATGNNQVEGYFHWKVINYNELDYTSKLYYEKKLNLTAKEFVRGTYNESKKEFIIKGYKKEDPDKIIGIDIYHIIMDENGEIRGKTSANGSWLGRIKGKEKELM